MAGSDAWSLIEKAAVVTGRNVWQTHALKARGLRSLWLSDGPHGLRRQAGSADHLGLGPAQPATCFPVAAAVANSWDVELAQEIGAALGAEAADQRVDVLLGPGLNIKRSPLGGRNFEYFSEDPLLSGKLAAAYVRGIQSRHVAACPKHFAANNQELRRMASDSVVDERTLREIYLTGFEIVVREARPRTIMSSYNLVGGVYASENHWLLRQVLRDEWGFDGAVVTDWGASNDIAAGLAAGCSLEMPAAGHASARQIAAAVKSGRLAMADLNARVREVVELAEWRRQAPQAADADYDAHHELARRAAAASAVLLKNDHHLLPLSPGAKVAVIGDFAARPRYQGGGSSSVNPRRLDSCLDVIGQSGLVMTAFEPGFRRDGRPDPALARAAAAAARQADVALVWLGLDEASETEGADRRDLKLPQAQVDLLAAVAQANPQVVAVLSLGGALETPWLGHCQALLHGYLAGEAGAGGLLDVIVGKVNPSGRLAETFPVSLADHPTAGSFPAAGRQAEYREGLYVGYRYFTTAARPVAFAFGFGLSYTQFEYSDLRADQGQARLRVTNTGRRDGAEVVQVYVHSLSDAVHRPERELKGFARVAIAAGESADVAVPLGEFAFRRFNAATGTWEVEPGRYEVQVGASSVDIRLTATVTLEGEAGFGDAERAEPADGAGAGAGGALALPSYHAGAVHDVSDEEFERLLGRPLVREAAAVAELTSADVIDSLANARSWLARLGHRWLKRRLAKAEAARAAATAELFILWLPLARLVKVAGGRVDAGVVDGLVMAVNGHFWRGLWAAARAYAANRRANRATARRLAQSQAPKAALKAAPKAGLKATPKR
ncbi:MAG: glycoside hydrolase family 3 C-terminal domain-containing protein [Bifidobacteriaceae bacterium]|nr:glycoside hydrolase family 3 C-terminal domain-containing protein [Bifidobacteriaceae bacterium]